MKVKRATREQKRWIVSVAEVLTDWTLREISEALFGEALVVYGRKSRSYGGRAIVGLWNAGLTQPEISERLSVTRGRVANAIHDARLRGEVVRSGRAHSTGVSVTPDPRRKTEPMRTAIDYGASVLNMTDAAMARELCVSRERVRQLRSVPRSRSPTARGGKPGAFPGRPE